MCPHAQINEQMCDGGEDFHMFVEDVCVHSLFVFPLFVSYPRSYLLSKDTTSQADQPHMPPFI